MPPAKRQAVVPRQGGGINFKAEVGAFEWHGCIPDAGAAMLPPGHPVLAFNIRFRRGAILSRKGSTKLNATFIHASNAQVKGLIDFQIGTRRSLYVTGPGCPNLSTSVGFYLGYADQDASALFAALAYYDFGTVTLVMGKFGGSLYLGQDNNLRKLQLVDAPFGQSPLALSGNSQDIPVYTFTGFTSINALSQDDFSGLLFMSVDNGAASKVATYDGTTLYDDLTGIRPPTCFFVWRDKLIAGFAAVANSIRVRDEGDSPGTWATVAPGAGTIDAVAGVSYRDAAYLIDGSTVNVWKYDGTTLAISHALPVGSVLKDIAVFDGNLFVAYTNTAHAKIAKFDGSTWTDIEKDLTAQDATITDIGTIEGYRDSLWAGVFKGGTGTHAYSPQYTTSGTWIISASVSLTRINKSMVY